MFVPLSVITSANAGTARLARPVMGTILEMIVAADDDTRAGQLAERAFTIAEHWDDVLTTWRSEGELAQLNAHAGDGPQNIGYDLEYALRRMLELQRQTSGAFDPAVGSTVMALRHGRPAEPAKRGVHGLRDILSLRAGTAELTQGQLDAGGIGKGIALDAIDSMLTRENARDWFLNFGGSSQLAHGHPGNGEEWIVAVAGLQTGRVLGPLALQNASLSTSRAVPAFEASGAIVDPRSGLPVTSPRMATVLASDAASADAWSTALIVLGREGIQTALSAGIEVLYEDDAGTLMTPGFALEHAAPRLVPSLRPRS